MEKLKKSTNDIIAGILLIIAGIIPFLNMFQLMPFFEILTPGFSVCTFVSLIFGILSIIGGVYAIYKDDWIAPLMGCIFALLTLLIPSMILGAIALFLLIISKD